MLAGAGLATFAALLPSPAQAHGDSRFDGGCSFLTLALPAAAGGDGTYTGEVDAQVTLYSGRHGNAVSATVTCELYVDAELRQTASGSGTGVVAFADTMSFVADETQWVALCVLVDYTSDETPSERRCAETAQYQFPPYVPYVTATAVYAQGRLWGAVDPVVCAQLATLAPGAGPVGIDGSGDTSIEGETWWDCPPYASGPYPDQWPLPTGAGANDGRSGYLALVQPDDQAGSASAVTSLCAFGDGAVAGLAVSLAGAPADSTTIRCRLVDAAGAVLYDRTVTASGAAATLSDPLPAHGGGITVCAEGRAQWGTEEESTGLHCRAAAPQ